MAPERHGGARLLPGRCARSAQQERGNAAWNVGISFPGEAAASQNLDEVTDVGVSQSGAPLQSPRVSNPHAGHVKLTECCVNYITT